MTTTFDLPDHLAAKADPGLVTDDERFFARLAANLEQSTTEVAARLDVARRAPAGGGQQALERDQEVHRLSARLRLLRRFGLDLCLGRMDAADDGEPVYVGRLGLTDSTGRRLLLDWRSPAAAPFFAASHGDPMGLRGRRRYRWANGRVTDYWDEVFSTHGPVDLDGLDGLDAHPALDDRSAFIASLGASRSAQMRDVLGTIQADQDAIIRAGSDGALVVDGGPGTGKTVVALHRTAYLLHAEAHLSDRRGGVLVVGPHEPYLAYVADVLPSLGEDSVRLCTLRDLVPEGAAASPEPDPAAAALKSTVRMVGAIDAAVRFYEKPPTTWVEVETPWADLVVTADDWAEAFDAPGPGTPHNEAHEQIWEALAAILLDRLAEDDVGEEQLGRALQADADLRTALERAWPLLEPTDLVGDLWTVPAYLRLCAPWLGPDEVGALQRTDPHAWTEVDLPLLDAARHRLGDPDTARRRRRLAAARAAELEDLDRVVDQLIATDDSEMQVMSMLRGQDLQAALVDTTAQVRGGTEALAGPFAHVVVDEAQELTDAQWLMVLRRCPSRSLTIVGDRAQARHGFSRTWPDRLEEVGLTRVDVATLTTNYRTPAEVMARAEPAIRAALPEANVPTSVRRTGTPVAEGSVTDLDDLLETWLAEHDGTACVIGGPERTDHPRVHTATPELAKGLEFDLVVLVDPDRFGDGIEGAVDRYVAMTRATQQLVVLTS